MSKIHLFYNNPISNVTQKPREKAEQIVNNASSDEILNTDSEDFAEYAVEQHRIDPINIDLENPKPVIENPQPTIDDGDSNEEPALRYQYAGNEQILRLRPNQRGSRQFLAEIDREKNYVYVYFPHQRDGYSNQELREFQEQTEEFVKTHYCRIRHDLSEFYDEIRDHTERFHTERRERILERQQRYESLGFDVIRREEVDEALKLDEPERRKEIILDDISNEQSGPGISDNTYDEIIEAAYAVGRGFERSPETYSDFGEEDYRNVILTFLEMNFEGSATGETFNKEGKSDILLRHNGDNIFIAECGMWTGPQTLSGGDEEGGKISQLLGRYLTWRDSKTAVILFVDRDSFSSILEKIPGAVEEHPLYRSQEEQTAENWWQYSFDRPNDEGNPVDVAVLAFDVSTSR